MFAAVYLVSIHKWSFCPISASIGGIACAAYRLYASAQSLDLLDLGQKSSFLNWKRRQVAIFKKSITGGALVNHVEHTVVTNFIGNTSRKVAPRFCWLTNWISPPNKRAIIRAPANPNPCPLRDMDDAGFNC